LHHSEAEQGRSQQQSQPDSAEILSHRPPFKSGSSDKRLTVFPDTCSNISLFNFTFEKKLPWHAECGGLIKPFPVSSFPLKARITKRETGNPTAAANGRRIKIAGDFL
jgi:hypothetical protein